MNLKFVRFGDLSPVKQEAYGQEGFHKPPARYGFYAFPESAIERFLLGKDVFDNRRMVKVNPDTCKKDDYGCPQAMQVWKDKKVYDLFLEMIDNKNTSSEQIELFRNLNCYYVLHKTPKHFTYTGNIWHHLSEHVLNVDVLSRKGSWVNTTYKAWLKAFQKEYANIKTVKVTKGWDTAKDHLEVFIERI